MATILYCLLAMRETHAKSWGETSGDIRPELRERRRCSTRKFSWSYWQWQNLQVENPKRWREATQPGPLSPAWKFPQPQGVLCSSQRDHSRNPLCGHCLGDSPAPMASPPGLPGLIPIQYPGPGPPCATPTHNGITSLLAVSNTQAPVCLLTFSQRLPPT